MYRGVPSRARIIDAAKRCTTTDGIDTSVIGFTGIRQVPLEVRGMWRLLRMFRREPRGHETHLSVSRREVQSH
jgi:hypothetical protein